MNPNSTIPPQEGVENLATARRALAGVQISSSHVMEAIIRSHSALEALFRQYLSQEELIPREIRRSADDYRETSFPDLVRAMSAYGKPSLREYESEILKFNQIRNQHAHGSAALTIAPKDAVAFVELVEEIYGKYSQFGLRRSNINAVPRKIMNPFVKGPQKAHWFTKYESDDNNRLVWAKGENAKVPGKGSLRCPILEFDTVFSVWMHEGQLPIDLAAIRFLSRDNLEVQIQVQLTAKVKDSESALIAVATRFDDSLLIVQAEVVPILREFCKSRTANSILEAETELAAELFRRIQASQTNLPFQVLKASLHVSVPILETAAERKFATSISFEESQAKEDRETVLAALRNARDLAAEVAKIERERKTVEAECATRTARARTEVEIKTATLANFEAYAKLTQQFQTGILIQEHPEIFEKIEIAKATNDVTQLKAALQEAIRILNAISTVSKNAAPITGVFGNIPPHQ